MRFSGDSTQLLLTGIEGLIQIIHVDSMKVYEISQVNHFYCLATGFCMWILCKIETGLVKHKGEDFLCKLNFSSGSNLSTCHSFDC